MPDACTCKPESYPFHCPRHECEKNFHWHFVCQHHPDWDPQNFVDLKVVEETFEYLDDAAETKSPAPTKPLRNPSPSLFQKAWNLAQSITEFVADGCETVSGEEYAQRLQVCEDCPERQDNRCNTCGCWLSVKARGRAFSCPLGKWAAANEPANEREAGLPSDFPQTSVRPTSLSDTPSRS